MPGVDPLDLSYFEFIRPPESVGLCLGQICKFSAVRSSNVFRAQAFLLLGLQTPLWFQSFRHQQGGEGCPTWALGGHDGPATDSARLCGPDPPPVSFTLARLSFHSLVLNDS